MRRGIFCFLAAVVFCGRAQAAAPLFREFSSFTNNWVRAKAFNDAGDVLASYFDSVNGAEGEVYGVLRDDAKLRISPVSDPLVQSVVAGAMSQRREDGHVYVAGTATCTDGFTRACVWEVAPNGTYVFTLAQLIALPADSQLPGEKVSSYAAAINKSGVMVGGADSHLASVPTRWAPPYSLAETFRLSSNAGCNFVDIDDNGNLLANRVQFDRGGSNEHAAAALVRTDGTVMEIPVLEKRTDLPPGDNGYFYGNEGKMVRGQWVIGRSLVGTGFRAFAWKIGETNAIRLPPSDPATTAYQTEAWAVNPSGQILGLAGGSWLTLWQYENGDFVGRYVSDSIPADSPPVPGINEAWLNDAGEIALTFNGTIMIPAPSTLRIYTPVSDGIVQVVPNVPYATEGWGPMDFTLRLTRAAGNDAAVTVNYRTVDGTAKAGVNYVEETGSLIWGTGDSEDKIVRVNLIDNIDFDDGKTICLELTSPIGAQLSARPIATGYIDEPEPYVRTQNEIFVGYGWGVAVLQGATEAIVRLQRLGGSDGKMIVTNFVATDVTATNGIDYLLPAGLTADWHPGEGGVKTISIPLLQTEPISSSRLLMVSADVLVEGSSSRIGANFGVLILPHGSGAFPNFYANAAVANGKLRMQALAAQGSTIELLKAPTLNGPWIVDNEAVSTDGMLIFETPQEQSVPAAFFQLRQK